MKNQRTRRRTLGTVVLACMTGAALVAIGSSPAVSAVDVGTEAALRAAITDTGETEITLTADITLTQCTDTGTDSEWGDLDRVDGDPLVIRGQVHTIQQTCEGARVMEFEGANDVTIRDLTITGGDGSGSDNLGGGIYFRNGSLTVIGSSIVGNQAGGSGGGINADFTDVSIERSTIAGNSAANTGGAYTNGALVVTNSTVTGNTSGNNTGGLAAAGDITLVYATVVGNTGPGGANVTSDQGGELITFASVIARPTGGGTNCDLTETTVSNGYNFSDEASCGLSDVTDREDEGDPLLGPLAANGGPTDTLLPLAGSALLDAIPTAECQADGASGITLDQRGVTRPQVAGCDIGAVELAEVAPAPITPVVIQPTFTG